MTDEHPTGAVQMGGRGPTGVSIVDRIEGDLAAALNHLIKLGHDLFQAYERAMPHIESEKLRMQLRDLEDQHEAQIRQLSECVESLHHEPAKHGDLRVWLEVGRVVIGETRGDVGILKAMAKNEEVLFAAYREARALPGLPESIRQVLAEVLAEEEKHRAFYDRVLRRFVG